MIKVYENFLPEHMAEALYNNTLDSPEEWWKTAYVVNGNTEPSYVGNSVRHSLIDMDVAVAESLKRGDFTYKFKRSVDHVEGCDCYQCDFRHYVQYVLKDHIERELCMEDLELNTMFFSVYQRGDFLSTHHDEGRGDVAFVLNLTKNWRPEYGGIFHSEGRYIEPVFNSLMLMELGDDGVDHFVSEVSQRAPFPRLAVSGWFKKSK